MKRTLTILIFIFLSQNISFSQDTNIVKFFPLKVGNVWVYQNNGLGQWCNQIEKRRVQVISSMIGNSHKYFLFSDTTRIISGGGPACYHYGSIVFDGLRIDSINGNIYEYSTPGCNYSINELMQDSLKAHLHDTIKLNCGNVIDSFYRYTCTDTTSHTIF